MSSQTPEDELAKLFRVSEENSKKIVEKAGIYLTWGQSINDLAAASTKVIKYRAPRNIDWEAAIGSWQNVNKQADVILANFDAIQVKPVLASGSGAAYVMVEFARPNVPVRTEYINKQAEARNASEQLGQVIDKAASKDKALALLRQFGFDKASAGKKSPIELFEIAWAAFERPVPTSSPVITSLIPIRECIRETIEALINRRPTQEPTGSNYRKVISIGNQLRAGGISMNDVINLAERWGREGGRGLVDILSGSKDIDTTREEWRSLLIKATLFLTELLQSLDPEKLKPRK